jgi:hypothetical protein
MMNKNLDAIVGWVQSRSPSSLAYTVSASELASAIGLLSALPERATSTVLIPDLFPNVPLEMLYVHAARKKHNRYTPLQEIHNDTNLSVALTAIGAAIAKELRDTGNDMCHHQFDDGAEVCSCPRCVRLCCEPLEQRCSIDGHSSALLFGTFDLADRLARNGRTAWSEFR